MQLVGKLQDRTFEVVTKIAITIAGLYVLKGCTMFFHEVEAPEAIKNENPFR